MFDRENDATLQKSLLNDNPLHDYLTSDRCVIDGITDVDYTLKSISRSELKTELDATTEFPLPFENITKLAVTVGAVNRNHFFKTAIQRKGDFAVSYWFSSQHDGISIGGDGTNRSMRINWIKGMNDASIKYIDAGFVVVAIADSMVNNGYFEKVTDDYILRCNAAFQYGKRTFYNISVQTKGISEDLVFDNIELSVGSGGAFSQNTTTTAYYAGVELLDKQQIYTSDNFREQLSGYAPQYSLVNEAIIKSRQLTDYSGTHRQDNQIVELLDNARNFSSPFAWGNSVHLGVLTTYDGVSIVKKEHPKFGIGYTLKSDTLLPVYGDGGNYNKQILRYFKANDIVGSAISTEILGFWIDRRELKGNELCFTSQSGGTWFLRPQDLATVGFVETRVQGAESYWKACEVLAVDGNYSYVVIRSLADGDGGHWLFNLILLGNTNLIDPNVDGVKELTLYNPTSLYDCDYIDPYHTYLSESQRNNSAIRGKTVFIAGDSQHNDSVIACGIARRLGVNIIHAGLGGHKVGYQNVPQLGTFAGWMYHWEARKLTLSVGADYYLMMISSNDGEGGGDSSTIATKAVLDSYPIWGDDQATIDAKMALFNALSEDQKKAIFAYKQTYSAYIKQINTLYPEAKVLLVTIPISSYETTNNGAWIAPNNADSEREANQARFLSIRKDIFELSEKHSVNVCDLFLKGGITWENFPTKVSGFDSVHWTVEAKLQFVNPIVQSILN